MFRRWWQRHGIPLILIGGGLSLALFLRETQGGMIQEFYALMFGGSNVALQDPVEPDTLLRDAKVNELRNRVIELEQQNQQLKELLGYLEQQQQREAIAAPIIGRSSDSWWQQITIGQGSNAGITEGFVVIGIGGLVGRVIKVTPHSSRVVLVSDANSQVGAMVSRSRYLGYITGRSSQEATMTFYDKVPDVKIGDLISTSNLSTLFPQGIPVGKVKSIDLNHSPAPIAIVQLTAPLEYLEWVAVQPFQPRSLERKTSAEEDIP